MGRMAAQFSTGTQTRESSVPEVIRLMTAQVLRSIVRHVPPAGSGLAIVDQVQKYIPPPRSLLRTNHVSGYTTTCNLNDSVQKSMFYPGIREPYASRMILDALPVGGTFLDVGANTGHFTYLAAAAVGPSGRVHAIEASPQTARHLRADLEANGLTDRVILHEIAVADAPGEMRLQDAPGPSPYAMRYLDPAATSCWSSRWKTACWSGSATRRQS